MTNKEMLEQMMTMMAAMQAQLAAQQADIDALKGAPKSVGKSAPKSAPKELVEFRKKDGTTRMVSAAQAAAWDKYRSRELTEGQKATIQLIRESKTAEVERTRALEKALGVPTGSFENTACTHAQATAAGWKGTKAELKAIKVRIRK